LETFSLKQAIFNREGVNQLCELIELDHILPFIHLLKSDQKIKDMDINIWKKICTHLNWEFIPSI
jgi:hypothetical protein